MIRVAILTISDKGSRGERIDKSGKVIDRIIEEIDGINVFYEIIPDEQEVIEKKLKDISDNNIADLILTTGGTGFAPRDLTPEATLNVIDKEVPGISEKIRQETCKITPMASLSRARSGIRKSTLIINFPGSPKAVKECFDVIKDVLPHGIDILKENVTEH